MKYTKKTKSGEFVTMDTNQDGALDILLYTMMDKKKTKNKKSKKKNSHTLLWVLFAIFLFPIFLIIILFKASMAVTEAEDNKAKVKDRK